MNLKQLVPQSEAINALAPEELAVVILRVLNAEVEETAARGGNRAEPRFHIDNFCNGEAALYEQSGQQRCLEAIAAGWHHLVLAGLLLPAPESRAYGWHFLTRRARQVKSDTDYQHLKKLTLYPRGHMHPAIESETYAEFLRGDYETAIFKAYKAIEVAVRRHANLPAELVGRPLMARAFNDAGALTDRAEVKAEQESLLQLFSGAIGRFKNPTSHREVDITDPVEAIELLQLASALMRIVDRRAASVTRPSTTEDS